MKKYLFITACAALQVVLLCWPARLQAQNEAGKVRSRLKEATTDSAQVSLLLELGKCYERNQPDSALGSYRMAYRAATRAGQTQGRAQSLKHIGQLLSERGRGAEAVVVLERALPLFIKAADKKGEAQAALLLADLCLAQGQPDKAIENYLLAEIRSRETDNPSAACSARAGLAACYREKQDYAALLDAAERRYSCVSETGDSTAIAAASIALGAALLLNEKPDTAITWLNGAAAAAERLGDPVLTITAREQIARWYYSEGRYKQALGIAGNICLETDSTLAYPHLIEVQLLRGQCLLALKKSKPAEEAFSQALALAAVDSTGRMLSSALHAVGEYYAEKGNDRKALEYQRAWMALSDSIRTADENALRLGMAALYNDADMATEAEEHPEQDAGVLPEPFSSTSVFLVVGIALLLLLVAIIIFFQRRHRRQQSIRHAETETHQEALRAIGQQVMQKEHELQRREQDAAKLRDLIRGQEHERLRLGRELHDGLGSMLAAARIQLEQLGRESGKAMPVERYLELQNLITRSAKELRDLAHELTPHGQERPGLPEMVQHYCERLSNDTTRVNFELQGNAVAMETAREIVLFRVVAEILTNTLRHSLAAEAFVSLVYGENALVLSMEDNGRGFDVRQQIEQGMGLKTLIARVSYLRGELDVLSATGKGTSYTITIPYEAPRVR